MDNTQGFYKKDNNQIIYAPNIVEGPFYMLVAEEHENYEYPVDGWIWASDLDDAINKFVVQSTTATSFLVFPENYKLPTAEKDETEFTKIITLLQLSLQQNKILPSTEITIWDESKNPHNITVERFLEIMIDYGMFCYSQR